MTDKSEWTKHGIEGLSDDPKYWATKEESERDEKAKSDLIDGLLPQLVAFHPDQDGDDLAVDLEMVGINTLIAIKGVIDELSSIIADLPGKEPK